MNSYTLLESALNRAKQQNDDPWRVKTATEERVSECGWTVSDHGPSRCNSRRSISSLSSTYSNDSGETLLNITAPPTPCYDSVGVYISGCKRFKEVPVQVVQQNLHLSRLILSNQNLNDNSVKALSLALTVNETVDHLDVSHNRLTVIGLSHIEQLLLYNRHITHLDVSYNYIGSRGLPHIATVIKKNSALKDLHAAGNKFGAGHNYTIQLTQAIQHSVTLQVLDLGYNQFGHEAGPAWAAALAGNFGLKTLTLRWNHLRWRGAMIMLEALTINDTLAVLDLAWNGVSDAGAAILARVLMTNTTLTQVDLTCNRISHEGALTLCEGLRYNNTLQVLKLNKNPMTTMGASNFLLMFQAHTKCALRRLELLDIEVDQEFKGLLSEIQSSPRSLEVIHGGRIIQGDLYMTCSKKRRTRLGDPLMVLFEHVKSSNLRLWDLFAQLDKDKSLSISREEFRNGMKEANVPLDEFQIERIMDSLDKDRNGEITFEELLEGHKRYRERERKKYETLLPFVLSRPSSARQGTDVKKSVNAPTPRHKASTIMSMSGSMGDNTKYEPRLSLPTINIISDDESRKPIVSFSHQFLDDDDDDELYVTDKQEIALEPDVDVLENQWNIEEWVDDVQVEIPKDEILPSEIDYLHTTPKHRTVELLKNISLRSNRENTKLLPYIRETTVNEQQIINKTPQLDKRRASMPISMEKLSPQKTVSSFLTP